jgi:ketosteroid isomerase-like protein
MVRATRTTIDLLSNYFDAMEAKDLDRLGSFYADDITQTFANAATLVGRQALLNRMEDLLARVRSLAHRVTNVWEEEEGRVAIFEVVSVWHLHDGSTVEINACSIFTVANGKFTDQRIYVDNAPVDHALH